MSEYYLQIQASDGQFLNLTAATAGASCPHQPLDTSRACSLPVASLRGAPFTLTAGSLISWRVAALNTPQGAGLWASKSDPLVKVGDAPLKPATPVQGSVLNDTWVSVGWAAVTNATELGFATLVNYTLEWDQGQSPAAWAPLYEGQLT